MTGAPLTWKRVWLSMLKHAARRLAADVTKSSVSSSSLSKLSGPPSVAKRLTRRSTESRNMSNESLVDKARWSLILCTSLADAGAPLFVVEAPLDEDVVASAAVVLGSALLSSPYESACGGSRCCHRPSSWSRRSISSV